MEEILIKKDKSADASDYVNGDITHISLDDMFALEEYVKNLKADEVAVIRKSLEKKEFGAYERLVDKGILKKTIFKDSADNLTTEHNIDFIIDEMCKLNDEEVGKLTLKLIKRDCKCFCSFAKVIQVINDKIKMKQKDNIRRK